MERIEVNLATGQTTTHTDFFPAPPTPLTEDEARALLPALTPRQLCMMLPVIGLSEATIEGLISAIPGDDEKLRADIEWRKATSFRRNHPLVLSLSAALQFEPSELDTIWLYASTI
ncbi:hypothetical protein EB230_17520 [Mesorhizobium sp. NZP2234]|uniref:hypothetical protein n=1 Tax=Mesorhizobium sp. NZP2234 TaxID=2483402 RepID=UPI0015557477|nr:hypothetical protein [Mesorhizobium sp. NZP2234]QKC90006.1 hypothetical protein EB230_17520 [Mesorhizobium sp. NZP2234]